MAFILKYPKAQGGFFFPWRIKITGFPEVLWISGIF